MSSFKKLSSSDVTVAPYVANKQWSLNFNAYPPDNSYITLYKGTNVTGSFDSTNDPVTENQYERLIYDSMNHLFYQSYSGSLLDTSSLANSLFYESASQQRRNQSYFNYNENPALIKNFPTGTNEGIRVIAVNQNIFGSQILPYHFRISSSAYDVIDDGKGNLYDIVGYFTSSYVLSDYVSGGYFYDILQGSIHIGNIFYSHGLGIITNQDYQLMFPLPPLTRNDYYTFRLSDTEKAMYPLTNDEARSGGTLLTSSITLFNNDLGYFATGLTGSVIFTPPTP
jgi:hypothetical protein